VITSMDATALLLFIAGLELGSERDARP